MAGISENILPHPLDYFLTLPNEKLILAERKHPAIVSKKIFFILFLLVPFYALSYFLFTKIIYYPTLMISSVLLLLCIMVHLFAKSIIDWYFHLFIVTNRKILEVTFSPLYSYQINVVLLDQVRCTEIDEKKHGFLNEIVDMGDIIITFDRPTHQEEFILTDVKNPQRIAIQLNNIFAGSEKEVSQPIWFKTHSVDSTAAVDKLHSFGRYALGGRW